jgi:hypothetical protein
MFGKENAFSPPSLCERVMNALEKRCNFAGTIRSTHQGVSTYANALVSSLSILSII